MVLHKLFAMSIHFIDTYLIQSNFFAHLLEVITTKFGYQYHFVLSITLYLINQQRYFHHFVISSLYPHFSSHILVHHRWSLVVKFTTLLSNTMK